MHVGRKFIGALLSWPCWFERKGRRTPVFRSPKEERRFLPRRAMKLAHEEDHCVANEIGGDGRASILHQDAVVAEEVCVLQRGKNAAIDVDAGEEQRSDSLLTQYRVEFVVPEARDSMFVYNDVGGIDRQIVNNGGTPIIADQE